MATLRVDSLRKEFDNGRIVAVNDLSLDVADGEFVTVVGPSGCGKSTTLRMLAGLEQPTDGKIFIDGEDITDVHARSRDVAMVFQNYALYPHKTVRQNMAFGLRMSTDLSSDQREEKVRETAAMMDIEELLDDKPNALSGGQKQRVALGRAIVREPDVFLFDEPLSNLDAKLRTTMRTEIQRLQDELGTTSIYVTHDQEEAMTMGDRIAILDNGILQQVGSPKHVYQNPVNEFVGTFVGSPAMNMLDVSVSTGDSVCLTNGDRFAYSLDGPVAQAVADAEVDSARLGIRPEDVAVSREPAESDIRAVVEVVEPIGSDNYLYLDLGESFIARVAADIEPTRGDTVGVQFDESDIHLFDTYGFSILSEKETERSPVTA
ncbi:MULTISPECIES: ABC transporter ATP-binding protein [Halomicrobium]|uniref:ABC-type D-xylose/L-arabinose transporter n=2 Tax=Halomicrobium mukohataei TaxID=57705 RepID=C7NWX9_HALMD|nr:MULTISPECIES: ABC transporter ATP-binding protein [Halomicrobium]ACV46344.1 ABC transporter related [Halomicrobium mukohataei DSM 12286]QCD64900.1 ABC transporter ATP-binding protein [Halomicrobium mukohataei]QFR19706.1 sn-glycerol-3-phosphate ABC transporter ATP-binding protein UgpC [Halomicrobium sp. ZPS1]